MGIMDDIGSYMTQAPERGSYLDQVAMYGNQYGSQFGISPQQSAQYFQRRDQADTLDFIKKNQVMGENPGPYPVGSPEMNQAMQPRFNPQMEMELAARTGTLGQYMSGMQAAQRQQQQQVWDSQNMTAAQYASNQLQTQKMQWDLERDEFKFNNLSAYQQAALSRMGGGGGGGGGGAVAGQPGGAVLGAVPAGHYMTMDSQGRPVLTPMQGGKDWGEQREGIQKLETGVAATDQMIDFIRKNGTYESGAEGGKISAGPRQTIIAGLSELNKMGVLDKGEREALGEMIADPTSLSNLSPWSTKASAIGKLEGIKERFVKASKAASSRSAGAASAPPPPEGFR